MSRTGQAHVLLVDDNPRGLEFLDIRPGRRSDIKRHSPKMARSPWARWPSDKPDIVVLDVTMPEMNGYQACRAIKRMAPKTPVIILTAKTDPADRFWAMQSGADAFLNKPIDPAIVVEKLKELLGTS